MKIKAVQDHKGFTLIETSIVILVLSFLLVPLFNFMAQQQAREVAREAETVNERVLAGLALFLKNNGRYPCPANPNLTYGHPSGNFARENCAAGGVLSGDVPTYALGLPYRLMVNQDGFKYIYTVTASQTNAGTFDGTGTLDIVDDTGNALADDVPFVIVNPGRDGKGARVLTSASVINACGSARDSENCDGDTTFRDMGLSLRSDTNDSNYYDDVIFYDLAREESTFWMVRGNTNGGMDIVNRNTGNIGINTGATAPTEKFEVMGGNINVGTGDVKAGNNVQGRNIQAGQDVRANGKVQANEFYYD